jgi:hypothetical protein
MESRGEDHFITEPRGEDREIIGQRAEAHMNMELLEREKFSRS